MPTDPISKIKINNVEYDIKDAEAREAIANLPKPMVFKGSVGTGGTVIWANLPSASASNEGFTYKVITDHATAPICKVGDTIISNGSSWVVIPSGDEPSGTVTSVGAQGASGSHVSVSGSPITSSGTLTISVDSGYSIPSTTDQSTWSGKQDSLVSGTNIKTINNTSLLGSGNINIVGANIGYTEDGYSVTITISDTKRNPEFWTSTLIYDNYDGIAYSGNVIGEITSVEGSTTVITTTGKLSIRINCQGGAIGFDGDETSTGGVSIRGEFGVGGTDAGITANVSGNGTISITQIDFDE